MKISTSLIKIVEYNLLRGTLLENTEGTKTINRTISNYETIIKSIREDSFQKLSVRLLHNDELE